MAPAAIARKSSSVAPPNVRSRFSATAGIENAEAVSGSHFEIRSRISQHRIYHAYLSFITYSIRVSGQLFVIFITRNAQRDSANIDAV